MTDAADFGPLMLALPERKRAFILHYLAQGCTNGADAARAAGYSDEAGGAKVRAHELLHQDAVLDALREQASKNLRHLSAVAIMKLEQIVLKDGSPDQLKSILAVLNRTGFDERTMSTLARSISTIPMPRWKAWSSCCRWTCRARSWSSTSATQGLRDTKACSGSARPTRQR
jgi:hypothetical protein